MANHSNLAFLIQPIKSCSGETTSKKKKKQQQICVKKIITTKYKKYFTFVIKKKKVPSSFEEKNFRHLDATKAFKTHDKTNDSPHETAEDTFYCYVSPKVKKVSNSPFVRLNAKISIIITFYYSPRFTVINFSSSYPLNFASDQIYRTQTREKIPKIVSFFFQLRRRYKEQNNRRETIRTIKETPKSVGKQTIKKVKAKKKKNHNTGGILAIKQSKDLKIIR